MKRVAIIGGGLGGLSAAGELARAGHAVTLFEGSDTLGGKAQVFTHDGLTFDTGPTLLTLPDTVREQFRRLGAEALLPRFHRLELQAQYRFADGRDFFCWEDLERAAESARAIHPRDGDGLLSFARGAEVIYRAAGEPYLEAPYEGMAGFMARAMKRGPGTMLTGLKLSTLDALARQHFASEELCQFAGRFATYTGASPYEASAAFAMIAHLERAFGVSHVEGGMGALARALATAVQRLGVTLHLGARARFEKKGARFLVGPAGGEAEFDALVVNADPLALTGRGAEPLSMSGYVFFVDVDRRVSLPHHTIVFTSNYRREFERLFAGQLPDEPTVYVCHPAATDGTMAPFGRSGLFVMVNVPAFVDRARAEEEWPRRAEALKAFCLDCLRRHFPELREASLRVVGERTPLDLADRGAPGGSIYGFLPHGKLGPFRRPRLTGPERGLFFAGGGTHPGGGVPLVMLSGRFAAGLARRHLEGRA
ncbi:MAG: phytoene desaturase [Myxococcaceae bacterium]